MKTSPNREQLVFLTLGGIILILIIMVVSFNLMQSGPQIVEEIIALPKSVQVPAKEANGKGKRAPAPVFSSMPLSTVAEEAPEEEQATPRTVVKPKGKTVAVKPGELAVKPKPVKPVVVAQPKVNKKPAPAVVKPVDNGSLAAMVAKPVVSKPKPVAKPKVQPVKKATGNFAVQLGSFSKEKNANEIGRKIAAMGLPIYRSSVTVGGKTYIRVRSGPYASRDKASKAIEQIKRKTGITGTVIKYGR